MPGSVAAQSAARFKIRINTRPVLGEADDDGNAFCVTVIMPPGCPFRIFTGPPGRTKSDARELATIELVKALVDCNELDTRLHSKVDQMYQVCRDVFGTESARCRVLERPRSVLVTLNPLSGHHFAC